MMIIIIVIPFCPIKLFVFTHKVYLCSESFLMPSVGLGGRRASRCVWCLAACQIKTQHVCCSKFMWGSAVCWYPFLSACWTYLFTRSVFFYLWFCQVWSFCFTDTHTYRKRECCILKTNKQPPSQLQNCGNTEYMTSLQVWESKSVNYCWLLIELLDFSSMNYVAYPI